MFLQRFSSWYVGLLVSHPYPTKSLTSGLLMAAGDLVSQTLERVEKKRIGATPSPYDGPRAGRMAFLGVVVMGPVFHNWFKILERAVPGSSMTANISKMVIDQVTMAPTFTAFFFTTLKLMEGRPWDEAVAHTKANFWPALRTNYMVWPTSQLINFTFVPLNLRVLWLNMTGFCWNIYLSYRHNKAHSS
eukprot:gnl/Spiro4/15057_TR8117_c0_g1_i1.p1 gnl/Spiro4/15057_TR8117_c0_g1~~gnl/Spiro4/15057_TR8117_c0_g1_i1.p1  ORF type:complete len:202 (-),score=48.94 gnl/Spiro4/15057_TR8117_c0_g1_i1:66-632(-)